LVEVLGDFYHQSPEQHKLAPGWQEPGLWRPRWIMDRVFLNENDEEEYRDRIHFKLKIDRTMEVVKSDRRPVLQVGGFTWPSKRGGRNGARRVKETKKLFEADDPESEDMVAQREKLKTTGTDQQEFHDVDGTWWWQDAAPMNYAKVKLETRELGHDGNTEKIRHEVLSDWGSLDGYAFNFRRGKVIKPKKNDAGLPAGSRTAGIFTIKVSPHRPMVSKDYMAFQ